MQKRIQSRSKEWEDRKINLMRKGVFPHKGLLIPVWCFQYINSVNTNNYIVQSRWISVPSQLQKEWWSRWARRRSSYFGGTSLNLSELLDIVKNEEYGQNEIVFSFCRRAPIGPLTLPKRNLPVCKYYWAFPIVPLITPWEIFNVKSIPQH